VETTDIWFASWLQVKGYKLSDFRTASRGKGSYKFDISDERWKAEKLAFADSDVAKVKVSYSSLRDLLF
jgi:hypothetical protein